MESQTVDARGLPCPMPVINTKKILDNIREGTITTIVDNDAAKENVLALARGMGCDVKVEQKDNDFYIQITKTDFCSLAKNEESGNTVIFCSSSELGRGSAELGAILMKSFMFTLVESAERPRAMLFVNSGVYLTCEGSPVLEHVRNLQEQGVEILSCGTCLDYFKLKEKLLVGQISNMYTIYEKLNKADKVISI
ncbi:MAG: sulfurtransferase-like selenium metabolism protein YedF [Bacillota bacterium]